MNGTRIVLVKPGDVLMLGNVTLPHDEGTLEAFDKALGTLRESLGLEHILVFEDDVDLAVKPSTGPRHEVEYRMFPVSRDLADELDRKDAFGRIGKRR